MFGFLDYFMTSFVYHFQNQIAAQQAIYVKQQNNAGSSSATAGGDFFNKPHESLTQLQNNFNDLGLSKDAPSVSIFLIYVTLIFTIFQH